MKVVIPGMLKLRSMVLFIFVLGIIFITYWFGYTSKLINTMSEPATTIQAPYSDSISLVEPGMFKMQDPQTSWTKPDQQAHATSSQKVNQHVQTRLPTLPIHERLNPKTLGSASNVHVRASGEQLRASIGHFRSSNAQLRADTAPSRESTLQVRASATQYRARTSRQQTGVINKTYIQATTQARMHNAPPMLFRDEGTLFASNAPFASEQIRSGVPVHGKSSVRANVTVRASVLNNSFHSFRESSPVRVNSKLNQIGATSKNHSKLETFRKTKNLQHARPHSSIIGQKSALVTTSVSSTSPQHRKTTPASEKDTDHQHTRVIILAHGRSGSSFLGGIFNAHPDIFFIYEPLFSLLKFTDQSSDSYLNKVEQVLNSILNCNFTDDLYLKYLSKFDRHRAASRPLVSPPFCQVSHRLAIDFAEHRKWHACVKNIAAHALNNVCRNKQHVVVKILVPRLSPANISRLVSVIRASSFPVRILNLVRDPRAMYFSQYRLGWIAPPGQRRRSLENGLADCKVRKVCNSIGRHLRESTRYADAIQLLRYEDMATNPEAFVGRLFSSLRLSPSEDVIQWMKDKNHTPKTQNSFSLTRESRTVVNSWQKNIPAELVKIVETRCRHIMKYLGYLPTNGSLTLLRNLNKPLFSDQWGKEQFIVGFRERNRATDAGQLQKC